MKRFRFRLERLLELRRHAEREWELKLARATGEYLAISARLADNRVRRVEVLSAELSDGLQDYGALKARELYLMRLDAECNRMTVELQRKDDERNQISAHFLEASKQRKVLDKLRDRRARESHREQLKEDFQILNELGAGVVNSGYSSLQE